MNRTLNPTDPAERAALAARASLAEDKASEIARALEAPGELSAADIELLWAKASNGLDFLGGVEKSLRAAAGLPLR